MSGRPPRFWGPEGSPRSQEGAPRAQTGSGQERDDGGGRAGEFPGGSEPGESREEDDDFEDTVAGGGGPDEKSFGMQVVTLLHGQNVRHIALDPRRRVR